MNWTAVVPLKQGSDRKTRLAGVLSRAERIALTDRMAKRLLSCLDQVPGIERIVLLAPQAVEGRAWREDRGRGLNGELQAFRDDHPGEAVLVIHADLPTVSAGDIGALLEAAAAESIAIAPDRHGTGTNALALPAGVPFTFAFGAGSRAAHERLAATRAAIVERPGLALDIDEPADLDLAGEI